MFSLCSAFTLQGDDVKLHCSKCITWNHYYQRLLEGLLGNANLEGYNFLHMAVNHTENFSDPETGAHPQGVESMWNKAKKKKSETMWNLSTND